MKCVPTFLSEFDFIYNLKNLSFAAATSKFYEIIRHTFDVYVTKFKFNPNYNQNITWNDPVLRNLIKLKKQAHKQFKLSNSQHDYITFSDLRKKCKALSIQVHANHILKIENTYDHPKVFLDHIWKFNFAFLMTSLGATKIRHENSMPIFIIQGQLYHAVGALLSSTNEEPTFY